MNLGRLLDIIWAKIGELNENEKETIFFQENRLRYKKVQIVFYQEPTSRSMLPY